MSWNYAENGAKICNANEFTQKRVQKWLMQSVLRRKEEQNTEET